MSPSERIAAIRSALRREAAPSLRRVGGWGNIVGGRHRDPAIAPYFFVMVLETALFIPASRGAIYLVSEAVPGVFSFHGRLPWEVFDQIYPGAKSTMQKDSGREALFSFVAVVVIMVIVALIFSGLQQLGITRHR